MLWLPTAGAGAGPAPEATEDQGGTHEQSRRQDVRHKGRRHCRVKRRQRGGAKRRALQRRGARNRCGVRNRCGGAKRRALQKRRGVRKRPCRRAERSPRQLRGPAPTLPSEAPPTFVPVAPILPPPAPPTPSPSPPAQPGGCAGSNAVPTAANLPVVRSATLCLVNNERAGFGLAPLIDNAQLATAAQGHADDMVARGYFSHTSADGRTFDQRIRNAGYGGGGMAENIAWGDGSLGTPSRIVGAWMNSAGHRANILNGALQDSGVGVAPRTPGGGTGGTYVHDFGAP